MIDPQFVHLRVHTEYSVDDGLVRIDELIAAAVEDGQAAIAITDMSNLFGAVKFYKAARAKGVKPVIGCDLDVEMPFSGPDAHRSRLLLLAKNHDGYLLICDLVSRAWIEGSVRGKAVIRYEWMCEALRDRPECVIALSGAGGSDIEHALAAGKVQEAESNARRWADLFPGHFYIEVQRYGQPEMDDRVGASVALASRLNIPVVATHPIQFLRPDEFTAHEARVCVARSETLASARRSRDYTERQHFTEQSHMVDLFSDLPSALYNSVEIAKRCNLAFELNKPRLPDFPLPPGISVDQHLEAEAKKGLEARLLRLFPNEEERLRNRSRYDVRLQFEVETICKMRFPGYFLIVAEFIQWAKNNGVPVGPGRGSGAGSLVAYALSITDLDPLAYNLLFERFLNPERVSMPDFDIDFCQEGRDRVIQHVKDLYGKSAVSQIATFGTMAAKGAVRDIVRVLDLNYSFGDGLSRLIPAKPGKHVTLAEALQTERTLADRYEREEDVRRVIDLAQQVEGITRSIGMHAGGVLIAPGKLTDFCPLYTQDGEAGVISQYDKDDVEAIGLVKFDFLGLTTLTVLDLATRYVRELDPSMCEFALDAIPMDDTATFDLLVRAETVAVFQLESQGMQSMLRDARPDRFEDIVALVALYRPGPMDLIPDFCRRKHGEPFTYPDPRTEAILSETYGIMVYQEQVMQMAQIVGGYTLGGADLLRRAMGKKKPEEMAAHRLTFREGAARDGLSTQKADEIFDLMEKFAGYGFNKSHAAAYALLSYQTAFLKTHHPAAFMAANLSLASDDTDKVKILVDDTTRVCRLSILPPDVNLSGFRFMPQKDEAGNVTEIRYGLGAVKGCGRSAIEHLVEKRAARPYSGLYDLVRRTDKKILKKLALEALIKAGAMDCWGVSRASLLATLPAALEAAQAWQSVASQGGLFDDHLRRDEKPYVPAKEWSPSEKLGYERAALGFCLSAHPFDSYRTEAQKVVRTRLSQLAPSRDTVLVAGVIESFKVQSSARGRYANLRIEDGEGQVTVSVYSEALAPFSEKLAEGVFVAARCRVSRDRFGEGVRLTAEHLYDIHSFRAAFAKRVVALMPADWTAIQMKELLEPFKDANGLELTLRVERNGVACDFPLPKSWRVVATAQFIEALTLAGVTKLSVAY